MDITFDSSSTAPVTYPKPPAEYIFQAGKTDYTLVKKITVKNKIGSLFIVAIFVAAIATGVVYFYNHRPWVEVSAAAPETPVPEIPVLPTATVINERLNVRSAPDSTKNNILFQVHKGDILTLTGAAEKGWLPVEYNGKAGFVSAELVKINE